MTQATRKPQTRGEILLRNTVMQRLESGLRMATGVVFVLAGAFKLVAFQIFAQMMQEMGVPLPTFFAAVVPLGEVVGGLMLITGWRARLAGAFLAMNMMAAIALVGIPGLFGRRLRISGSVASYVIGDEVWRLPLEIFLLVVLLRVALKPAAPRRS